VHIVAIAISIALCVTGYAYLLKSINEQLQIRHEINLKLPGDKKFEPTLWWYGTWQRFRDLQKELMPGSPRPRRLRRFQVIGFVLLASGMLLLLATVKL
jgi:hypothetical protein